MIHVAYPIPETDDTISRPIAFALIEQIKDITNIRASTDVTYIGQGGSRKQFGTSTNPNDAPVMLEGDRAVVVEIEELPSESFFANETVHQNNQLLDFYDKDLGLCLRPVYAGFEFVITFTYRTPSRAEAIRWRNDVRSRHSQGRGVNIHEAGYIYQLTPKCIDLIYHLYTLKEKQGGSGLAFDDYFSKHISNRAYPFTDSVGGHQTIFFKEVGTDIQGVFDFTYDPRKQEKTQGQGWEVQFTYTVELSKPIAWSMQYPIVVHNQPIDKEWIPLQVDSQYIKKKAMGLVRTATSFMETYNVQQRSSNIKPAVHYPLFDEWIPDQNPPGQRQIATWLLALREKDDPADESETVLATLSALGDVHIDPDILDWIKQEEYQFMDKFFVSPVQIHLYMNEKLCTPGSIYVNSQGEIVLKDKVNIKKRYRIVLTLCNKIADCEISALRRLSDYPKAMCKILKMTNAVEGEIHNLLSYIDLREFSGCTARAGTTEKEGLDSIVARKTVMVAGVTALRMEDFDKPESPDYLLRFSAP